MTTLSFQPCLTTNGGPQAASPNWLRYLTNPFKLLGGRPAIPFGDAWKVRVIPAEAGLLVSLVSGSAKGMPWAWFNES